MYTVLTGAKINVGDFLITQRTEALLRHLRPEHELVRLPHWEPLDAHLAQVNASAAVIIMGGPGFQPGFFPKVYRLTADPAAIKVPIVPLGLGWKGYPGDEATLAAYRFTAPSLKVLRAQAERGVAFGCRDHMTVRALENHGFTNARMTGCPVWYHLPSLDQPMHRPAEVDTLVFTPAQRPIYREQSVALMAALAERLPRARRVCVFHRGIDQADALIPAADAKNNAALATAARRLGFEVLDAARDLAALDFYAQADLHVGYRVHAHLAFLSQRRPSFLLHEDGRGRGMSAALNHQGVDAFTRSAPSAVLQRTPAARLAERVLPDRMHLQPSPTAVAELRGLLDAALRTRFASLAGVAGTLDAHYASMRRFIEGLP